MIVRFHPRYAGRACEGLDAVRGAPRLAAWRVESVRTIDGPALTLDLTLAHDGGLAVVGAIEVDRFALAHCDRSPFVVPAHARPLAAALAPILDALAPALAAELCANGDPEERFATVSGVAEDAMAARRGELALGAARYASVARARGAAASEDAYLETALLGALPPHVPSSAPPARGEGDLRVYVALSDAALAERGAAYAAACEIADALGDAAAVEIGGYDGREVRAYACIHAVGIDDPDAARELMAQAADAGLRRFVTPLFDDPVDGGFWGARAHAAAYRVARDETTLATFAEALAARALVFDDGVPAREPWEPRRGYLAAQREAIAAADAVFVASAGEAQRLRARLGAAARFCAYVPAPAPAPIAAPQEDPYVLAIAPLTPEHALATVARAATLAGLPLRFSGPVVDGAYAARCASFADARASFAAGDAGGARVAVDCSWIGTDLSGLARYALHGVPIVAAPRSEATAVFGEPGVRCAEPGDEVALARALRAAWNDGHVPELAATAGARCRREVLRACLAAAYATEAVPA